MDDSPPLHAISLNTAAALTGRSMRTWQRRIEQGQVRRLGDGRALVAFEALRPELVAPLAADDVALLARADQGEAQAQADIGALFALAALQQAGAGQAAPAPRDAEDGGGSVAAALHFLEQAAQQGQADAMHWLGLLHAAGLAGGSEGDALALMWVSKAAAHGHAIARGQVAGLMPGATPEGAAGG